MVTSQESYAVIFDHQLYPAVIQLSTQINTLRIGMFERVLACLLDDAEKVELNIGGVSAVTGWDFQQD